MPRYVKKPVEVLAEPISKLMASAKRDWYTLPGWVRRNHECGNLAFLSDGISIKTLEGTMHGRPTDFLIQGVNGEIYPCKPDVFEKTYALIKE